MRRSTEQSIEELFYSEAEKRMAGLDRNLALYIKNGTKKQELAHTLHTLKGSAAMIGLKEASATAHEMEDVLLAKDGRSPAQLERLQALLDQLHETLFPKEQKPVSSGDLESRERGPQRARSHHAYKLLAGLGRLRGLFKAEGSNEGVDNWHWKTEFERELKLMARSALDTVFCPVEELFAGLLELSASLLEAESKQARLVISSQQRFILRDLVPDLRACLIHLLSNSVVHGLESPEERKSQGKKQQGLLSINVRLEHDQLELTFGDDGQGVDFSRLKEKLSERDECIEWENLSRHEKLELLFQSGTTLADQLTVRAGRGVGLSAVRDSARRLGGTAGFVESDEFSTAIRLEVPVPIFMEHCLEVRSGNNVYLITSHSVESVSETDEDDCCLLSEFLGTTDGRAGERGAILYGVETKCAVTQVLGLSHILVYPLPRVDGLAPAIVGIAEHDTDPGLVYVIDISRLRVQLPTEYSEGRSVSSLAEKILVVDDSLTTRSILVEVLRRAGYEVVEATDGKEGLKRLWEGEVNLIISDYEMPNMNGLEFLEAVRDDGSAFGDTAFLLFTSRDEDETFEKALLLGADRCLSKAHFEEGQFLQTVERFLH